MTLSEPVTLLTDSLLGAWTLALAIRLLRRNKSASAKLWASGFLATGIGAIAGGTYHGFFNVFAPQTLAVLWKLTVYLIGIAAVLLLTGAVLATTTGLIRRLLLALGILEFLVYAAWMARHDEFRYVIYDYVPAMVLIAALFAIAYRIDPLASKWIVGGIAISFAAAGVQHSGFALHRHFNHNDLYHVVQMIAMYALYRGGLRLVDRRDGHPVRAKSEALQI